MFKVRPQDHVVLESCLGCFQIPLRFGENGDAPIWPLHAVSRFGIMAADMIRIIGFGRKPKSSYLNYLILVDSYHLNNAEDRV